MTGCRFAEPAVESHPCRVMVDVLLSDTLYTFGGNARLIFYDINRNSELSVSSCHAIDDTTLRFEAHVEAGFYHITYQQDLLHNGNQLQVRAYSKNQVIAQDACLPAMRGMVSMPVADFVLAEIFFTGTLTPEGKSYTGDKYFVLFNNADSVLYADGLVLMESKFMTIRRDIVTPDRMDSAMTVDALYRIPGDGQKLLQPRMMLT